MKVSSYHRNTVSRCDAFPNLERSHLQFILTKLKPVYSMLLTPRNVGRLALVLVSLLFIAKLQAQTPYKTLNYLYSISGTRTIAGQQGYGYWETMRNVSGKYPGMWGEDLSFVISFGGANMADDRMRLAAAALEKWNQGAMVNIMFHACPPNMNEPCTFDNVKSRLTNAQWDELITNGTPLNTRWKQRLDAIAPSLQYLEDNGVEVLFRPFHEMNHPSVFWWAGRPGPNGSLRLYQITRDYLVNVKGLTNLIWVWNLQDFSSLGSDVNNYDPGSANYDMLSLDIYYSDGQGITTTKYNTMLNKAGSKPIALGEVDVLPTSSLLASQPRWTYFVGWRELTQQKNSNATISAVYNAGNVVSLDEMPGWNCNTVNIPSTLQGETYCQGSGVSSEPTTDTGGGRNLSSIETNDWAAYRINVPVAGTYTVQYRVAALNAGTRLRLERLGGGLIYGSLNIPQTSGWQNWTTISHTVQLSAGIQDIALVGEVGGFNVNWFSLGNGPCTVPAQPGNMTGNTSVAQGSSQTYSIAAVSQATSYTWTLPSGWSGSSTGTSITTTVGSAGGNITVRANNACGAGTTRSLAVTVTSSPSNIAYNKPVSVTSIQGAGYEGSRAVDANGTTRWASATANNQNFVVDLGATYNISRIRIAWEAAYARDYQIQISGNNSTWTTIREFWGKSSAAPDDYTGLNYNARWLKVYCINRATQWGFSIFEFEAYGTYVGAREKQEALPVEEEEIPMFPNPTDGKVVIFIPEKFKNGNIELTTVSGKQLISEKISESEHTVDLTAQPSGLYIVQLRRGVDRKVLKLFKK